jgi:hypothetical protein
MFLGIVRFIFLVILPALMTISVSADDNSSGLDSSKLTQSDKMVSHHTPKRRRHHKKIKPKTGLRVNNNLDGPQEEVTDQREVSDQADHSGSKSKKKN